MNPPDPSSMPTPRPSGEEPDGPAGVPSGGRMSPALGTSPRGRLWPLVLSAGLIAAIAAWLGGEADLRYFSAARAPSTALGPQQSPVTLAGVQAAELKTACVAMGLFGGSLGLALGLAGGIARRSVRAGGVAALIGLVVGTAAGSVATLALVPVYHRLVDPISGDMVLPMLVHGGIAAAVGAAGGLAFGLGLGDRRRIAPLALAGLLGAVLGAALFQIAGAAAFPLDKTGEPIASSWIPRLLARLSTALAAAVALALAARSRSRELS